VGNSGIFRVEGLDSLFKMLRVAAGIDGAMFFVEVLNDTCMIHMSSNYIGECRNSNLG
jgi:hypothetical protein